ncbi:sensor histidine kinase [Mycobacterium sherrisii]|uniref:Regulator of Sig8 n=1 Tax=Mycobacterium sherrisii TaxID=243061 RepID=A0A1E3T0G9_9MYCO|nr:sensor histidine kinase [Mycobacterium sherrisii]MCV7028251.1 sensor histidine kinase [Mycobacterium sherrisii]MEC4764296.1 sensor histidine kinase [Mycobacterium sherrisii]ODR07952.1 regulator of Sig8 [Mycobacterium sherrisii]ORW77853.1 regulator of Sig8 [Mycobacterium sherrisii]
MMESGSAEVTTGTEDEHRPFVHSAFLFRSQAEYLETVLPFVLEGLATDERVLVAVPGEYVALLSAALGGQGSRAGLQLLDIAEVARNPSRFLALEGSFAEESPDRRARIVSQVCWPGRTSDEFVACMQHEALVNTAFQGRPLTVLCPFDAQRLGDEVLAGARAAHPMLCEGGSLHVSPDYAPDEVLAQCNQPLPANPGAVTYMVRKSDDLKPARSFAVNYAGWVGLSQDGIEDLQLVATELATNSLMYTDGACRLAFWRDADHLVCEARDSGRLDDPLVGRLDPGPAGPASRGLYLVNAISDLVRTHTASTGTTIQAYLRMSPSSGPTG